MVTKEQMLSDLRLMLRDVFAAKEAGATHQKIGRAQGYIDGYMKALLDAELVSKSALLGVVAEERSRVCGPATRTLDNDAAISAA